MAPEPWTTAWVEKGFLLWTAGPKPSSQARGGWNIVPTPGDGAAVGTGKVSSATGRSPALAAVSNGRAPTIPGPAALGLRLHRGSSLPVCFNS
ncbi:uncharacterized protein M6G45_004098 isoform 3-T4 [Spheniscus humboldti]